VAKVLIIGASRGIGLETLKAALRAGHSVRAFARSARRIRIDDPKLEKIPSDALQMDTVSRCAGVLATACTQGKCTQHGKPQAWSAMTNWKPVRDRPGALGWRRGS
jgi:NAD(P)-dependent dehydrogenase (short-subunit alcohol dehydrogenase family)